MESDKAQWFFKSNTLNAIVVNDEAQFLSGKELFLTILESIKDGVSVLDVSLGIKYVNASMKNWYYGNADVFNKKCYEIYHNRTKPCDTCPTLRAIETKTPHEQLVKYSNNGKDFGWQQLYSIPVLNKKNMVILVIEYIRDVTFQKKVESNLMDLENRFCELEKQNDLLLTMLKQKEDYRDELEQTITANVEKYIKPSLNYLKKTISEKDINMVSGILDEIVYPLTKKRPQYIENLSPRELQIATFIKEGIPSKEIAQTLFITKKAVDYHRTNIRKKLNLNRSDNLQIYLKSHL